MPQRTTPNDWNVYQYPSFTDAMTGFLDWKRSGERRAWSLGSWAKRLKMGSSATLTNILKGRRLPSPEWAERIAQSMDLDALAREYFLLLHESERLPSAARKTVKQKLRALKTSAKTDILSQERFRAVGEAQTLIIREMINLPDFREDPEWISKRCNPPIDPKVVQKAILALLRIGMLRRDRNGKLRASTEFYDTSRDVPTEVHREYHRQCARLAERAITHIPVERRDFTNNILSLPAHRIHEMKAMISEFCAEFTGEFESTDGRADEIFHLNIQLYPVTKTLKDPV